MPIKLLTALLLLSLLSCDFNKSASKDFLTGISTVGDGLACDDVYLSDGENKLNESTFIYGERLHLNFENITGFEKEEGFVFPGLQIIITGESGDTLLNVDDLYVNETKGYDLSPLLLQANLIIGTPIFSNHQYTIFTKIWDKKGTGIYKAKMDFDVIANDQIKVENSDLMYDEVYLFSNESGLTLTENHIQLNETIYLVFAGLEGFADEAGYASLGLSLTGTDSDGNIILNEQDLVGETEMAIGEIKDQLAPSFVFTGEDIINPVTCEVEVWDKKSDRRIKVAVDLIID